MPMWLSKLSCLMREDGALLLPVPLAPLNGLLSTDIALWKGTRGPGPIPAPSRSTPGKKFSEVSWVKSWTVEYYEFLQIFQYY